MIDITATDEWSALAEHHDAIADLHLRTLFADDPGRGDALTASGADLVLDYSKHRITARRSPLLTALARRAGLPERTEAMFAGVHINTSEDRAVLHTALRAPRELALARRRSGRASPTSTPCWTGWARSPTASAPASGRGHTGERITAVVNIGIGGSDLGPVMAYEALQDYADRTLTMRFVSNIDPTDVSEALRDLDPATTLFIVSSKTFTTLETLTNARACAAMAAGRARRRGEGRRQALRRGVDQRQGGHGVRHRRRPTCSASGTGWAGATPVDSAIGLSLMIAVGQEQFARVAGGHDHAIDGTSARPRSRRTSR